MNFVRMKIKRGYLILFECLVVEIFGFMMLIWKLIVGVINFGGKKVKENLDLVYVFYSFVLGNYFENKLILFFS